MEIILRGLESYSRFTSYVIRGPEDKLRKLKEVRKQDLETFKIE